MSAPSDPPTRPSRDELHRRLEERVREELDPHLSLIRLIGRGSAAGVYLAREPALRRLVAVKVLLPELADDRKARLRFEREAQSAARISHPNVVAVYRVGSLADDTPYIVMQYVRGRSLGDRLVAEGPLPVAEVRRFLADVASGLEAAHRRRIVHRDVKPANVLYEEETGRVFLTDFGIAAMLVTGEEDVPRITTRGHVIGDLRYRSPEQLRGEEVTELADIYGLGLLGFELLTGESPYETISSAQLVTAHIREAPRRPSDLRPELDAELEALLLRCLEKVPAHRPAAADVVRHLVGPPRAPRTGEPGAGRSPGRAGGRGRGYARGSAAPVLDRRGREGGPAAPPTAEAGPGGTGGGGPKPPAAGRAEAPATGPAEAPATDRAEAPASDEEGEPAFAPPDDVIRFRALGSLELLAADGRRLLSVLAQPKRVALLAYLAVGSNRGFKRRDTLLGVFWPEVEQERARHSLRQAVYVLRQGLGADVVASRGDEEVGIAPEELWCDAVAFERAVDEGRPEEALEWYAGDLLPGFFIPDAPEFEHWLGTERQRLRRLASDAAWSLAEARERSGNAAGAAHWARRAAELSPWDEGSLCRLIELLDRLGDRTGAIRAYEQFSRRLAAEYDAEPAPETRALMRRVRAR